MPGNFGPWSGGIDMDFVFGLFRWSLIVTVTLMCMALSGIGIAGF